MGKSARLRAQRKKAERVPLSQLMEAVIAIGDRFGTAPRCTEAACLLEHAGRKLGYKLTLRPVSVLAVDTSTNSIAFMGQKVTAMLSPEDRARAIDHRPGGAGDTGHVVVTCEDPSMLFDPNLRQLGSYGIDAPSVALRISSTHPEDGQWTFSHKDLRVYYLLDDDNLGLLANYDTISKAWEAEAADLVRLIRAGATADDIARGLARA